MNIERTRITGKGQIQIPAKIRIAIGAKIGDELTFILNDKGEIRVQLVKKRSCLTWRDLYASARSFLGSKRKRRLPGEKSQRR